MFALHVKAKQRSASQNNHGVISCVFTKHCTRAYGEFLVELVGEQRVGQLSEVQLAQGAHRVDVLPEDVPRQVRDLLRVKLVPGQQRGRVCLFTQHYHSDAGRLMALHRDTADVK